MVQYIEGYLGSNGAKFELEYAAVQVLGALARLAMRIASSSTINAEALQAIRGMPRGYSCLDVDLDKYYTQNWKFFDGGSYAEHR